MTDMEKKVMVRLCAKILSETDLYDTDMEVRNLIDWICVSEQIKSNNNEIRSITDFLSPDVRGNQASMIWLTFLWMIYLEKRNIFEENQK